MTAIQDSELCANCGTLLQGEWCHVCGQKRLKPGDRSLARLLLDWWEQLTSLEGRWWQSFRDLLLRPGALSSAYLKGQRKRYLAPLTLFLLINLVYFVRSPMTDFNLSLLDQACLQPWSALVQSQVSRRIAPEALDCDLPMRDSALPGWAKLSARYQDIADEVSRSMVIAHVPVIALFLGLLAGWRRWYYAEHVIVALHLFAFFLLYAVAILPPVLWLANSVLPLAEFGVLLRVLLLLLLLTHWTVAVRRVYGLGLLRTVLALPLLFLALGISHFAYRFVQFWIVWVQV
ncbi:MAG: DUF3667 domain-containing protein [Lysobacterales bacterium]|nr:DUF3667 domain-containing protein [Xanthomonadales bacterium]MCB1611995.1 DUF3667 domain-containing protein [Xanthomonadales bacterium]